eukprot:4565373-Pyramimonas_sp.AAC.1
MFMTVLRVSALYLLGVGDGALEGLGAVQQVVGELGGQLAQLLLDLVEALLRRALQPHACPGPARRRLSLSCTTCALRF